MTDETITIPLAEYNLLKEYELRVEKLREQKRASQQRYRETHLDEERERMKKIASTDDFKQKKREYMRGYMSERKKKVQETVA